MKNSYENYYREIEEKHPWFVARSNLFLSLMPSNKNSQYLILGGAGSFLKKLNNSGYKDLSGVEVSKLKWELIIVLLFQKLFKKENMM